MYEPYDTKIDFRSTMFGGKNDQYEIHAEGFGTPYHLIFVMHGFRGSHHDMNMIWNFIMVRFPKSRPYLCTSVENFSDNPSHGILSLGKILAEEVADEVKKVSKPGRDVKISFIGHSLGGLIIRAAIQNLEKLRDNFHALITLATPHCGYIHSKSKLLSAGIWVYDKISNNPVLSQIR